VFNRAGSGSFLQPGAVLRQQVGNEFLKGGEFCSAMHVLACEAPSEPFKPYEAIGASGANGLADSHSPLADWTGLLAQ
jgi:hypothetical protein